MQLQPAHSAAHLHCWRGERSRIMGNGKQQAAPAPAEPDEREKTNRLLLDLFMLNFESMGAPERLTSSSGMGLAGHIYGGTAQSRADFRDELAELMIEHNIDKVDVAWRVPHVLRRFRPGKREAEEVIIGGYDSDVG